jgi:hypothetical protein
MKELIEKISSYNLFNYLLPGILFAVFTERVTSYKIIQSDIFVALFLYYFIGLVISRIGSIVLEPLMRRTRFVTFAPYRDYVTVAAKDAKLETLSEANNMYRTLCALFVSLGMLKLLEFLADWAALSAQTDRFILLGLLFVLFAAAYRKQTRYIRERIEVEKQ